ncbi:MAG: nucleotidyltransferase family protein [Bacteroidales bacterium]
MQAGKEEIAVKKRAFILAAGIGSRLGQLTSDKPKALVRINEIPLIEIVLKKLIRQGFSEIMINLHHFGELIREWISNNGPWNAEILFSDESGLLRDTGGAIRHASAFFSKGPVLVHNVDILSDLDLSEFWTSFFTSDAAALLAVRSPRSNRRLVFDEKMFLTGWENIKTGERRWINEPGPGTPYSFSGISVLSPGILEYLPDKERFSLIDLLLQPPLKQKVKGYIHDSGYWLDAGRPEHLDKAAKDFPIFNPDL